MFHHFHNHYHVKGQGSIDKSEFRSIIKYYLNNFNLLSADIFLERFHLNNLNSSDVCITFDDNLKCQFDIALPVLNEFKIKAFWFVYSSPFDGSFEKVEIFRYFRSNYFKSFENFYESFFHELDSFKKFNYVFDKLKKFDSKNYLSEFSFYTREDKIFRYVRNNLLGEKNYYEIMESMIKKFKMPLNQKLHQNLWMSPNEIKILNDSGHIIGLHSHTHPTRMGEKNYEFQENNYSKNKLILENIIDQKITCMSHPCNSYNENTLGILNQLGIRLGFRANLTEGFSSSLEIPRIDHSEILKLL